jgi:hypothetical protein
MRSFIAALVAVGSIAVVILPFWKFASAQPQVEIPHVSRDAIWLRPFGMEVLEQGIILVLAIVATFVYASRKRWSHALLALGMLFLGVLSLGATTPIPRLLFRSQWRWLTYDKFHHWAALFCLIVLSTLLFDLGWLRRRVFALAAIVLLPATLLCVGHKGSDALQPEFIADISPLVSVLRSPEAENYRHLTLGFGDQFCRLDILGRSPNVDGDYHTARRTPILRQSGIGTLDATKYYKTGKDVLEQMLARATDDSLRWVFVNDEWYFPAVLNAGFELREVWGNGVTLFEREDVAPLPAAPVRPRSLWSYLWGLLPLTCFALALMLGGLVALGPIKNLLALEASESAKLEATLGR